MERGVPESKPTIFYYFPTVLPNPATYSTPDTREKSLISHLLPFPLH